MQWINRHWWYSQPVILNLIAQQGIGRETAFLTKHNEYPAIRYMTIHNAVRLDHSINWHNLKIKDPYCIYNSLATYNGLPMISNDWQQRSKQYAYLREHLYEYMTGYDLLMDIDAETWREAHYTAAALKAELDKRQVPYTIKNSSHKGIHIIIPQEYLPLYPQIKQEPTRQEALSQQIKQIAQVLHELSGIFDLKEHLDPTDPQATAQHLDLSIVDKARLVKTPYSLATGLVCLPLTDAQFESITPENLTPEAVYSKIPVKNRGCLQRMHGLNSNVLTENTRKFFDFYS